MMLKGHFQRLRPSHNAGKQINIPAKRHSIIGVGLGEATSCALRSSESSSSDRVRVIARADIDSEIKDTERQLSELEKLPDKEKRVEQLAFWIGAAMAFGAGIWFFLGPTKGKEYFAGYLLGEWQPRASMRYAGGCMAAG